MTLKDLENIEVSNQMSICILNSCVSDQIGNLLIKAGFAIVVCINSDNNILEDCTKEFEKTFYAKLLEGASVRESFNSAQNAAVCCTNESSIACCCAHDHDEDCIWYE